MASLGQNYPASANDSHSGSTFQLYSAAPSTNAPSGSTVNDPYFYNTTSTVNLSGKIGPSSNDAFDNKPSAATSLINSVTSVVETGYNSARQVVFGDSDHHQPGQGSAFSLFSLSYQQIVNFAVCICVGMFFMFLAFLFLPMVVFTPQKFTLLFTLGCMCWIAGLAMLQGPKNLLTAMMQKERLPFSLGYGASLLGTLYATLIAHSYILTLLCATIQIISLAAFIVSYFPGGIRMLTIVKDVVFERAKGVFGVRGGTSVLPI